MCLESIKYIYSILFYWQHYHFSCKWVSKYPLTGLMSPVPLLLEWVSYNWGGWQFESLIPTDHMSRFPWAKDTGPLFATKGACSALLDSSHPLGMNAWMNERPLKKTFGVPWRSISPLLKPESLCTRPAQTQTYGSSAQTCSYALHAKDEDHRGSAMWRLLPVSEHRWSFHLLRGVNGVVARSASVFCAV